MCVRLIRGLQKEELVLLTHGDSVDKVADGFKVVAQSGNIVAGEHHHTLTQTSNCISKKEIRVVVRADVASDNNNNA